MSIRRMSVGSLRDGTDGGGCQQAEGGEREPVTGGQAVGARQQEQRAARERARGLAGGGGDLAQVEHLDDRPVVEVFNLRQVATATGESAGSFAGGSLFLLAGAHGLTSGYWFTLAALG